MPQSRIASRADVLQHRVVAGLAEDLGEEVAAGHLGLAPERDVLGDRHAVEELHALEGPAQTQTRTSRGLCGTRCPLP